MRDTLVTELIHYLESKEEDADWELEDCPKELSAQLEQLTIPLDLKRMLQWNWPNTSAFVYSYSLESVASICSHDYLQVLMKHGCFPIGSAGNGDEIVVRFTEDDVGAVGFASHDQLWEHPDEFDPAKGFARIAHSLEEFLFRLAEGLYLPHDFHAAEEWDSFRIEHGLPAAERHGKDRTR